MRRPCARQLLGTLGFVSTAILFLGIGAACAPQEAPTESPAPAQVAGASTQRPVLALDGSELSAPGMDPEFMAAQELSLAAARTQLAEDPDDLEAAIWVGRHLAYLARYREAIEHYGAMLERFEDEPRLLRHRGHRYLTVREVDAAIVDFERAALLIDGRPDRVEEDGLPNARKQPTSTLGTNIWYHLGLAYFVRGDFWSARQAYEQCLGLSKNPDMEAATRHWLHMTLRRLGEDEAADEVLEVVREDWDIIENEAYHSLLLLARGERSAAEVLGATAEAPASAAARFGVGHHFLVSGDLQGAARVFEALREGEDAPNWASFGVLAAEAEALRPAQGWEIEVARRQAFGVSCLLPCDPLPSAATRHDGHDEHSGHSFIRISPELCAPKGAPLPQECFATCDKAQRVGRFSVSWDHSLPAEDRGKICEAITKAWGEPTSGACTAENGAFVVWSANTAHPAATLASGLEMQCGIPDDWFSPTRPPV